MSAHLEFLLGTVGYSLVRFSTKKQACGDSFRRQVSLAEAFATRHNITLDTSLHEADIRKLGMSALSGEHVVKGPLRKFFAGIGSGDVKPGSILLVGEWSRLTRQVSSDALKLVINLMELGIGIVDLQDDAYYTLDRYNADLGLQLGLQLKISMAHKYSADLRHNLTQKWKGRREAMQAGKGKPTNASPTWLTVRPDGTWNAVERDGELWAVIENPDVERAIQRVKADRFLGLGKNAIATRLNDENQPGGKVPPFRHGDGWHASAVEKLVKNEALMGIHQPKDKKGEKIGDPKPFYPRVMSNDDWYRMQWPANQKAARGRRTGGVLNNLFAELFKCGSLDNTGHVCGGGLIYENKGKDKGGAFLVCTRARRGLCPDRTRHPYGTLEAEMLNAMTLFDVSRIINTTNPAADQIAALEAEIATKNALIEKMADDFGTNVPPAFAKRAMTMQADVDAATARLTEARRNAKIVEASANLDAHAEFREMVAGMGEMEGEELYQLRLKLARELGRLIEGGEAASTELLIRLHGFPEEQMVMVVEKSRLTELRLVEYETGDFVAFPREQWVEDPDFDPTGQFETFVVRRRQQAA